MTTLFVTPLFALSRFFLYDFFRLISPVLWWVFVSLSPCHLPFACMTPYKADPFPVLTLPSLVALLRGKGNFVLLDFPCDLANPYFPEPPPLE